MSLRGNKRARTKRMTNEATRSQNTVHRSNAWASVNAGPTSSRSQLASSQLTLLPVNRKPGTAGGNGGGGGDPGGDGGGGDAKLTPSTLRVVLSVAILAKRSSKSDVYLTCTQME